MLTYRKKVWDKTVLNNWFLFVPGWAMDGHIFDRLSKKVNAIIIDRYDPFTLKDDINELLISENILSVTYVGYSMGAMAGTFVSGFVSNRIWLSPALHYPGPVIDFIKNQLLADKAAYLKEFYKACFVNTESFNLFWAELGQGYSQSMDTEYIMKGLGFLEKITLKVNDYDKTLSYSFIFGDLDAIVPKKDMLLLTEHSQKKGITLSQTGHYVLESIDLSQSGILVKKSALKIQPECLPPAA